MSGITYKQSGVDIQKANQFVSWIGAHAKKISTKGAIDAGVSFGSLFEIGKGYREPILVSSTDGVGTKLMIANLVNKHDTVGIDLVAMNVNDILCAGAKPLFFLDYLACGSLKAHVLREVIKGVIEGCRQSGCSLIGGETAEMPGIYKLEDYDLAGFAVGVVEKKKIISGALIKKGDLVVALASSGLHSNGFSLARKALSLPEQKSLSHALLKPTTIYVQPVLKALKRFDIKGMAHITGGAFVEKMTKILPKGKCFAIDRSSWIVPKIFQIIQSKGNISDKEMFTTFNMGVGFVLVVDKAKAASLVKFFDQQHVSAWVVGEVIDHKEKRILL
jgi:phosphoribosylformylglycinamidine cyclo-ligase